MKKLQFANKLLQEAKDSFDDGLLHCIALCTLHSALCTLHSALCTLHSALCTRHCGTAALRHCGTAALRHWRHWRHWRHGTARHGTARHGTARHGTARHGTTRHGRARQGTAGHGRARQGTAHGTRHTAHGTRHTARGTRHTAHGTRHTAHGTRHTTHGTRHTAHGTRHTAHGTRHTAHGTRHTAHGTRHTGHGTRGTGHGTRGTGHGARGTGHGARGTGHGVYGARGTGHGARGTGHGARGTGTCSLISSKRRTTSPSCLVPEPEDANEEASLVSSHSRHKLSRHTSQIYATEGYWRWQRRREQGSGGQGCAGHLQDRPRRQGQRRGVRHRGPALRWDCAAGTIVRQFDAAMWKSEWAGVRVKMEVASKPAEEIEEEDTEDVGLYKGSSSFACGTLTLLRDTKMHLAHNRFYRLQGLNQCDKTMSAVLYRESVMSMNTPGRGEKKRSHDAMHPFFFR